MQLDKEKLALTKLKPSFLRPAYQKPRHPQVTDQSIMSILRLCNLCKLERSGHSFLLTLTQSDEHLLNPTLIDSIREYLHDVKSKATRGSVLITTGEGESFCRGFDYRYAQDQAGGLDEAYKNDHLKEMINGFKNVVADLISLPMPTIAAINGYATEAGFMLGLSHDFLTVKTGISAPPAGLLAPKMSLPGYFAALIRSKVGSPSASHSLLLKDLQFDAKEAVEIGVLDPAHDIVPDPGKAAEHLAKELARKNRNGEVYAEIRKALYPEICKELGLTCTTILPNLRNPKTSTQVEQVEYGVEEYFACLELIEDRVVIGLHIQRCCPRSSFEINDGVGLKDYVVQVRVLGQGLSYWFWMKFIYKESPMVVIKLSK